MAKEYGNDFVILTDEDGRELEFEVLGSVECDGMTYVGLIEQFEDPVAQLESDGQLVVLKAIEDDDGTEVFVTIDNEELATRLRRSLLIGFGCFLVMLVLVMYGLLTMDGFAVDANGVVSMESGKYLNNFLQMPIVLAMFLVGAVLLVVGVVMTLCRKTFRRGIWFAGPGTVLAVMALFMIAGYNGTAYYPSTAELQSSLTLSNSCSSEFTLHTMAIVSLIIPFVVAYIAYFWRKMDKKSITTEELNN